jgi:hypothetical protein
MSHFFIENAIMQEAKLVREEPGKAIFRMVLQTADSVNQNKRLYPQSVLAEGMKDIESRMNRRAFLGELDHPVPTGNKFDEIRQTTVMLKEVSHLIRDYDWRGKQLIGELETTNTPNGGILLGLLKDQSGIGMSMRGMASLKKMREYNEVEGPLMIITYDSVSLPSHSAAVVDFKEMKFENKSLLVENCDCGTVCTADGTCYLANYFDKLVETRVVQFFESWI